MIDTTSHHTKASDRSSYLDIFLCILSVFIVFTAFVFWVVVIRKTPPLPLLLSLVTEFNPFFNMNIVTIVLLKNASFNLYMLYLILSSSAIALLLKAFFLKTERKLALLSSLSKMVFTISLTVFCLTTAFQSANLLLDFSSEYSDFSNKSLIQKNAQLFRLSYGFAISCRSLLPGKHYAKLTTDLDLGSPVGDTLRNNLAYHLYPINIYNPENLPEDCYVLYFKDDLPSFVPPADSDNIYIYDGANALITKKGGEWNPD